MKFFLRFASLLLLQFCFIYPVLLAQTPDSWTQKANFAGTGRYNGVGFNIGNKGYIGTGANSTTIFSDIWEYDPATDTWAQKADFGGGARHGACAFTVGRKAYIGGGASLLADGSQASFTLWEYDPVLNTWVQKSASFPGGYRSVALNIDGKVYVFYGSNISYPVDIPSTSVLPRKTSTAWALYDIESNTSIAKTNLPIDRCGLFGFSIDGKGYLGGGVDNNGNVKNEFYEYNPNTNSWTAKANFPGTRAYLTPSFVLGNKGYVGLTGSAGNAQSLYEYNPTTNIWTSRASYPDGNTYSGVGFSIGNKGYIGTGSSKKTFYEYTSTETLTPATALKFDPSEDAGDNSRLNYVSVDNPFRAYQKEITVEFWMYAPSANMPFGSIMGQGSNNVDANWVWLMHPETNGTMTFYVSDGTSFKTAKCNIIAGSWHHYAATSSAGSTKFYVDGNEVSFYTINGQQFNDAVGGGLSSGLLSNNNAVLHIGKDVRYATRNIGNNDPKNRYAVMTIDEVRIWNRALCVDEIRHNKNVEINPAVQTGLQHYYSFNQGFVNANNPGETILRDLSGNNRNGELKNFSLYGTSSNWVASGFTSTGTYTLFNNSAASITGQNKICIGTSATLSNANPGGKWMSSNTAIATINEVTGLVTPISPGSATISYTTNCGLSSTMIIYVSVPPSLGISGTNTICSGGSTVLTALGPVGTTYSWSTGANTSSITVAPSSTTTYLVTGTNIDGCSTQASSTVTVNAVPTVSISGTNTICSGSTTTLTASGATGTTYLWNTGATTASINVSPTVTTTYTVTATNSVGCTNQVSSIVTVNAAPTAAISGTNTICSGGSTTLIATGGGGGTTYAWNTGATTFAIPVSPTVTTTYSVTLTNTAGCTSQASRTVTVNPTPSVTASSNSPVVAGNNLQLSANGATNYSWSGPNGFTSSLQNPVINNPTAAANGTYTVTGTNAGPGCTNTASVNVTVLSTPATALKTDGVDDHVTISNPFRAFNKEITVEFWMNTPTGKLAQGSIMGQSSLNVDGMGTDVWLMHPDLGGTNLDFYVNDAGTWRRATVPIRAGGWHHYVGVASEFGIKFYVDGVLEQTGTGISTGILNNANSILQIGKDPRHTNFRFADMTIDEVRIWSRALCLEEITNNKNCELNPTGQNGLQQYYRFNQGIVGANNSTETSLTDFSGNNRNGVLSGFALTGANSNWVASGSTNTGTCTSFTTPTAPITGSTTICGIGNTVTLSNAIAGGLWSSSNTSVATINANTGLVTALSEGTTIITYKNECGGISTITIRAVSTTPPTITGPAGGTNACPGNTVTLTAPIALANYQWFRDGVAVTSTTSTRTYNATVSGTYTATRISSGCTSVLSNAITVTIADAVKPSITCPPNQTIDLDANCKATLPDYRSLLTVSDNCTPTGSLVITQSPAAGSEVTDKGSMIVVFTVRDAAGNESTCNITVDKKDVTAPIINCPGDITVTATSTAGAVVNYVAPVGTDNCSGATTERIAGPASGSTFPIGTTTITHRVTDAAGLSTECSFTVTVSGLAPVIVSPGNQTVNVAPGTCTAVVNFAATETTGIPASTITYSIPSGSTFGVGSTVVTATATNAVGTSSVQFTITVRDAQPPVITCPADITVTATSAAGAVVNYVAPVGTDNCSGTTTTRIAGLASGSVFPQGTTTVTYRATDAAGNITNCSFNVTVNAPTLAASALNFDGVNDFVAVSNPFRAFQKEITVEFWMNTPNTIMPYGSILGQSTSGVDNMSTNVWLMHPDTKGNIDFLVNDGGVWKGVTVALQTGWHHYVGVASEFGVRFYVDGVLAPTISGGPGLATGISNGIVNNPNSVLHIGKDVRHNTGRFGNITIDEVRIWSRVLCQEEIQNNMNCELNPQGQTGLEEYYRFNQGFVDYDNATETSLIDLSGKGRNGQLNNLSLTGNSSNWTVSGSTNNGTCSPYIPPTAPITGTTSVCIGASSTLSNTIGGGLWSSSNTNVATVNTATGVVESRNPGTTVITYRTECGSVITTNFTVKALPVISISANGNTSVCPGNTVMLEANSIADATYQWKRNGVDILGANDRVYQAPTTGSYSATVTVDGCSSAISNAIGVTIADTEKPVITTCPPNQSLNLDATCKATLPDYRSLLTVSDNCTATGSLVITQSPAAGSVVNDKGSMIVAFTVRDASGNESTCTITVDKKDVTAPVISCPAPITVNNATNTCGAVVNFINPTATDNCSGGAFNFWSGGEPNNYQNANEDYVQLYTSGRWNDLPNSSLNRWIVEFNDIRSNVYSGYTLIGTHGGHTYYYSSASATWTNARAAAQSIGGDLASINTLAESTFLAPYGGNTWVGGYQDKTVPGFQEPGNASQNYLGWKWVDGTQLGAGQIVITQTAGLPSGSVFPVGVTTNTFVARDESGNEHTCSFTVTVRDIQPPVISCPANINITATSAAGAVVNYTTPVGTDNCSGATTERTAGLASGSTFPIGTTTVTYRVTDAAGLFTQCSFTVTVVGVAPVISCPATITVNAAAGTCAANVNFAATETVGIPASTITYTINGNPVASGASFPVGTTTVVATATNAVGSSSCSFTVTVVDNQNPTITAPADVQGNNTAGLCTGTVTLGTPVTADNCGVASVTNDAPTTGIFPVGSTTVTWTVRDVNGNHASTTQTVVVNDTELPVVKTNNIVVQLGANGQASITTSQINNGSTDNCGIATVVLDKLNFNCSNVGENTVLLTVTDIHGNSASANATVTVQDNILPTVITQPVAVTLVNGAASVTAAQVNNGSFDNCGIATMTVSPANFNCNNIGSNTVILTVTDVNGNTNTRSAIVTVVGQLPSCSIKSVPTSNVFTGGNPNNIYLGYGAQSTVLNVAATGGSSYTYQWSGTATQMLSSTTAAAPVFTPTAPGNYTFTVTVTNNFGCTSTCSITICVKDIRVPGTGLKGSPAKVYICHVPPGNPNNPQTLEISVNAVGTHIGQHSGDRLGTCAMTPCAEPAPTTVSNALTSKAVVEGESKAATDEELKVTVMPNPSATHFTLKLESKYDAPVNMRVVDVLGRVVDNRVKLGSNATVEVGHNYQSGTYFAEFIQGNRRKVVQLLKIKR
jgi:hypothetical protein